MTTTKVALKLDINGRKRSFAGPAFTRLIDALREEFGLTGAKEGCGEGECGACTVLVDGEAVNSCLIPVCQVEGRKIETVESLGTPKKLSALQQSFLEKGGAQCGICTPGMLMTACAFIRGGGSPEPDSIRNALAGNLCRCTGYQHIVESVAAAMSGPGPRPKHPQSAVRLGRAEQTPCGFSARLAPGRRKLRRGDASKPGGSKRRGNR